MSEDQKDLKVPKSMQEKFDSVTSLIDEVCDESLNDEYKELCHRAAAKLCRKRPSPLQRGKPASWACGIVYAMGQVNFLFDKNHEPYLSAGDLCDSFGVSKNTGGEKARQVRDHLKTFSLDPAWTLASDVDDNLYVWLIEVDGFIMDARSLPLEIQIAAYRKGLIPYVPGLESKE